MRPSSLPFRLTLAAALTLLPLAATGQAASAGPSPDAPLHIRQLHPDFYVIDGTSTGQSDVPNLIVYVTSEGVVLVDPWFAKDYEHVLKAVKSVTDQPVRYVINTHFHSDHTGANGRFPAGTGIVGQVNTRKHMLDHNLPGPPNIVFTDETSLFLGGQQITVRYLGRGHTDGDAAVYFPEWKTVCLGDMMAGTRGVTNPVVDYANGGNLAAWPHSLDRALEFDIDTVIPGHGSITNRAGLVAHRDKVEAVGEELRRLDAEHKTKPEVQAALISDFDFKPINLRALDGLIAEFQAPAPTH